jgi:hypothetical protein
MFEMNVDVEGGELADVDAGSGHATAPMMTFAPGDSA